MGSNLFSILYGGSSCSSLPTTSLQRCPCTETDSGRMRCAPCRVSYTLTPKEESWLICRHDAAAINDLSDCSHAVVQVLSCSLRPLTLYLFILSP